MNSPLGEYAMKAIAAGTTILKIRKFLSSEDQTLELTREEVEAIMLTIKEQIQEIKRRTTSGG